MRSCWMSRTGNDSGQKITQKWDNSKKINKLNVKLQ